MAEIDKNPEELTPEELLTEVDNVQEEINAFESQPKFGKYLAAKLFLDQCGDMLRKRALEFGDFRSKYFQFQKVEKETTDWKAVCRHLVDTKKVKEKDMADSIEAFTEKKPYGKMARIKDKDLNLKLA